VEESFDKPCEGKVLLAHRPCDQNDAEDGSADPHPGVVSAHHGSGIVALACELSSREAHRQLIAILVELGGGLLVAHEFSA
jgi:hypothetical protein